MGNHAKFVESDYQQLNLFENDLKKSEINQLRDQLAQKMGKDILYYARNWKREISKKLQD